MKKLIHIIFITLVYGNSLFAAPISVEQNVGVADDKAFSNLSQESRAQNIFTIVRCPTCAGQSVKDSASPASISLRTIIRAQINQGLTDNEILTSLREVYGNQIVSQPVFALDTIFLWLVPAIILIISLLLVFKKMYKTP